MFTKKVTDSDEFVSLSASCQALYMHLCMTADDDGFNNQVQIAMWKSHASLDDIKVLLAKRYIIQFDTGVIVITHWRMANALRKDRYTPTAFQDEFQQLKLKENGTYSLEENAYLGVGCRAVADCLPQDSIGKDSLVQGMLGVCTNDTLSTEQLSTSQEDNTLCAEQFDNRSATTKKPIFVLKDGTEYELPDALIEKYKGYYPEIDVDEEIGNMSAWLFGNPQKRITKGGVSRFMNAWLLRKKEKMKGDGRNGGGTGNGGKDNRNVYTQIGRHL